MTVEVDLSGTLNLRPPTGSNPPPGSNGCGFGFANRTDTKSAAAENGSKTGNVSSPSAFVALPVDTDMRGRLLLISMSPDSGPVDVQLTLLASGVVTVPQVQGLLVLEKPASDAITGIAIQGTAQFAWQLTGARG